jgi:hypothetical protein
VIFLGVYSVVVFGASIGRVRGSLSVDKASEGNTHPLPRLSIFLIQIISPSFFKLCHPTLSPTGKISLTEMMAAMVTYGLVGVFGTTKWFNPFSKKKGRICISTFDMILRLSTYPLAHGMFLSFL